ncbi:MAG TPA: metallopeptidase family protein [Candidatus Limnocylindrales bacterium]|nr:metallopeptidase family protein [Candidatus Limnocylindrales bacterium]
MEPRVDDETFEDWVFEAFDALPGQFRERLGRVAITIEDWPTREQLDLVGVRGMYGLYSGAPLDRIGADFAPPARITIFRGPLARDFRTPEALRTKVIDTVHHEVAHHFGISDERLHELSRERGAQAGGGHGHGH